MAQIMGPAVACWLGLAICIQVLALYATCMESESQDHIVTIYRVMVASTSACTTCRGADVQLTLCYCCTNAGALSFVMSTTGV